MISGKLPFNLNESPDDLDSVNKNKDNKEKNKKLKYEILNKEPKYVENISDELRDLLKGLLNKDPEKRLTCEQILNHPWLANIKSHKIHLFSKEEKKLLTQTFMNYRKRKFKELIENLILWLYLRSNIYLVLLLISYFYNRQIHPYSLFFGY